MNNLDTLLVWALPMAVFYVLYLLVSLIDLLVHPTVADRRRRNARIRRARRRRQRARVQRLRRRIRRHKRIARRFGL